jgi:hypothetical protein
VHAHLIFAAGPKRKAFAIMGKGRILKTYDSRAIFENLDTGNCLVITQIKDGWQSKDIQVIDRNQFAECNSGPYLSLSVEAIYGFYDLLSGPYVAVVTESENFLSTNGIEIRKVGNLWSPQSSSHLSIGFESLNSSIVPKYAVFIRK